MGLVLRALDGLAGIPLLVSPLSAAWALALLETAVFRAAPPRHLRGDWDLACGPQVFQYLPPLAFTMLQDSYFCTELPVVKT